jgi:hypothetical protein
VTDRGIFWISGWSVPAGLLKEAAERALPSWRHEVIDPGPNALARAKAANATVLAGFSFGASLLLTMDDPRPRLLLAPFVDLKSESGLGGAMATTRIRQQLRQLKRDPTAAVAAFHQLVGMNAPPHDWPLDTADLVWGLEQMLEPGKIPPPLPPESLAVAGRNDPLLDIAALQMVLPSLHVIEAAHDLEGLLAAAVALQQDAA